MSRENNCPFCASPDKIVVGKPKISGNAAHFIRHDYRIVRCNNCRFYFVNPEIDLTLNEWAELYGAGYFGEITSWYKKQRLKDLENRFDKMKKRSRNEIENFLDVGCGEGLALVEAHRRGWKTYGIDITDNRVLNAKDDMIKFIKGDLITAALPRDFFDAIYIDSVLEHVINPSEYLKDLYKILKPGGVVYIGVPNEDSFFNDFKKFVFLATGKKNISAKIKPFEPSYHVVGFTIKSLIIAAEKANFKILDIINFAARFEFRKYHVFTRGFWLHLLTLPIDLIAIVLRREVYLEAFLTK